jgi:hypothetical protein
MDQQNYDRQPEQPRQPVPLSPHVNRQSSYPDQYGQQPNQQPNQQQYDQQYSQQQQPETPYRPSQLPIRLPSWFPRDPMTLGVIAAGGLAVGLCLVAFCLGILLFSQPVQPPSAPSQPLAGAPTIDPNIIWTPTPAPTATPIFNPADAGNLLNPYQAANLAGMTAIMVDVYDQAAGNYVRQAQIAAGSEEMAKFVEALNISVYVTAPNTTCPDYVRFSITRADNTLVIIGVCLKSVVILRGDISGLNGGDLPMGPYFTDILLPYLPDAYKQLLDY